ncbi:MAG: hypothetical protein JWP58_2132 [Hymenobacter sp.]|nr:hypothetical protein [Hymenobacter sp.]
MHHSDVDYWRYLQSLDAEHPDLPTPRVCRLLERTFNRWQQKPLWLREDQVGHLFRDRPDLAVAEQARLAALPVAVRKALAVQRMLELITEPAIAHSAGTCELDADELIVGSLPPFSVGQGKEFVRYLTEEEEYKGMLGFLNELSPMGHIVPDHGRVVNRGLRALIRECKQLQAAAPTEKVAFYESVIICLQAVIDYAGRLADLVRAKSEQLAETDPRREHLAAIAERLHRVPAEPSESFADALQCIYLMHCALHWTVEIVPLGRLDQILQPFYDAGQLQGLTSGQAQELMDCFWLKLDERVILNYRHAENRYTAADGVLTGFYGSSNFDQGGLLNQWMQQVTIGGVLPNDDAIPTDACNAVTQLCLHSARRLPLNSPTLDLRVHAGTPERVLELAAQALLSGGAHPVLLNDDRIIAGLMNAGQPVPLRTARNYACDGCYETMFAGETEFSFGFVPANAVIEFTLNRGAGLGAAGPMNLRGDKNSWRSKPAAEIKSWEEFQAIMQQHTLLSCHRYLSSLLANYGNKEPIAPSPLLSALIDGCIQRGQDLVAGGANYRIFSPLMTGISTAADSLYVIKKLVFDTKQIRLNELVTCLATNWGSELLPVGSQEQPAFGLAVPKARIAEIKSLCRAQPKFGYGHQEVDELAWQLIETFCQCVRDAWDSDRHKQAFAQLKERYGASFNLLLAPGVGTFEQYLLGGLFVGASADGRHAREGIASDLSPAPLWLDEEPIPATGEQHARMGTLEQSMKSYKHDCMNQLGDGAPVDYNIPEDYPPAKLQQNLRAFANGEGGSIATFTVASPATMAAAQEHPQDYNLVRVRMGGWTEFFIALFPAHQAHHRRRPLFVPSAEAVS